MSQDVEIHLIAYDEASDVIRSIGSNLSTTFTDIEGNTQNLVTTTDNATNQIADDYNNVVAAGNSLQNSQTDMQNSCGQSVMAVNNLALSGAMLASSFVNLENRQVAVDRANLMVERSTLTLQKAQDEYNKMVAQYGVNSAQAQAALEKLNIALDAHNVAVERAGMATRNLDMAMVTTALSIIPSLIAMITTVSHVTEIWEGIQATMDIVMDANPIFLVIAAIGALIAALMLIPGAWDAVVNAFRAAGDFIVGVANSIGNAWNSFIGSFTGENKQAVDSTNTVADAVQRLSTLTPEATKAVSDFKTQLELANEALMTSNLTLLQGASNLSEYQDKATGAGDQATVLDNDINNLNTAYQKSKDAIDKQIATLQAQMTLLQTNRQRFDENTNAITQLNAKEADLKSQLDGSVASLESEKTALEEEKTAATNSANELASLTTKYDELQAAADVDLGKVKAAFDAAFNSGDMNKALGIVQDFATQYGLTLSDAEKIINAFNAKQATIPQTMEEQLLTKAQNDFASFQSCISGKAFTLQTDVTGKMSTMAGNITNLIKSGLVGEAQNEMQSYVNCNTDKVATMVTTIQQDMTNLTTTHNQQILAMETYADTLTGDEKAAVLNQISDMTAQYEAKMGQLQAWQKQLLGTMASDVSSSVGQMTAAMQQLQATFGQAGSDIYAAIKLAGQNSAATTGAMATSTAAAAAQITNSFNGLTNDVTLTAKQLQHNVVGGSIWTDMLTKMEDTTTKSVAKIQAQFKSLQTEGLVGGMFAAPEVLPGAGGKGTVNNMRFEQPLVVIQGSADKATVDYAAKQVLAQLKTIMVEPTSTSAPSTQKRIRKGAVFS